MKNATSHDYARSLQQFAEFLLSRNAFELPWNTSTTFHSMSYFDAADKDKFIAAVRALGTGEKKFTADMIEFVVKAPGADALTIRAPRKLLCRLIRPAEYDCDPLLSPEEEKSLGGAA